MIKNSVLLIHDPENQQGKWHHLVNCEELHVEIGSGKGDYWYQMASCYPQNGWIGIERDANAGAVALRKVVDLQLPNARFIIGDAKDLQSWFAPLEIDVLHLNFVDPWPKKAHAKRRLTHPNFLKVYRQLLSLEGKIEMKTDSLLLMEYSRSTLQDEGFSVITSSDDYQESDYRKDMMTEYENRFRNEKQAIYRTVWQVKKQ